MIKYKLEDGSIIDVTDYSQDEIDFLLTQHPEAELIEEEAAEDFQKDSATGVDVLSRKEPTPMGTVLDLEDTSSESQELKPRFIEFKSGNVVYEDTYLKTKAGQKGYPATFDEYAEAFGAKPRQFDTEEIVVQATSPFEKLPEFKDAWKSRTYNKDKGAFEVNNFNEELFSQEEETAVNIFRNLYKGSGIEFEETDQITDSSGKEIPVERRILPQLGTEAVFMKIIDPKTGEYIYSKPIELQNEKLNKRNNDIINDFIESNKDNIDIRNWTKESNKLDVNFIKWKKEQFNPQLAKKEALASEEYLTNEDLFKTYEKYVYTKGIKQDNGIISGTSRVLKTIQPYENEINNEVLKIKKKNPNKSNEDVISEAKIAVRNNLYESARNEAIYDLNEEYITESDDKDKAQGLLYSSLIKEKTKEAENYNTNSKKFQVASQKAEESSYDFKRVLDIYSKAGAGGVEAAKELNNIVKKYSVNPVPVNETISDPLFNSKFNLKEKDSVSANLYNLVNAIESSFQSNTTAAKEASKEVNNSISAISDTSTAMNAVSKNYELTEKYLSNIGLGFSDIIVGTTFLGANILTLGQSDNLKKLGVEYVQATNEIRESYVRDVSFDDAFSSASSTGKFIAQEVSNQIPILAAMIMSGGAASIVVGASSAGSQMMDMQNEIATGSADYSSSEVWLKSIGFGLAEGVFSQLTTVPILKRAKLNWLEDGVEQIVDNSTKNYFKSKAPGLIYEPILEAAGEIATTGSQNLIVGNPFSEGMDHAGVSGFGFGLLFAGVPFFKGVYNSQFSTYESLSEVRKLKSEISDLEKRFVTSQSSVDSKSSKQIASLITTKTEQLNDKIKEQEAIVNNNLTAQGATFVTRIIEEQAKLQNKAKSIQDNKNLDKNTKAELIKDLKNQFNYLVKFKQKAVSNDSMLANETEWEAFKGLNRSKSQEYLNTAESILKDERDGREVNKEDINRKAYDLYFGDLVRAENAKQGKPNSTVFKNFKSFETVNDAIADLDAQEDLDSKTKNIIIKGLKEGNDGYANPSTNTQVAVVENQVKNQRRYTKTHEVGHFAFWELLGKNSKNEAFKQISDQLLVTLKNTDRKVYDNFIKDAIDDDEGNIIPAEVISRFLEYVSENKITNVQKAKGIAGLFGVMVQKQFSNDYNFDFRGEQDIFNFVVGIGKKIKDGTLTTSDIEIAKESDLIKGITKKVDTSKNDSVREEVSFSDSKVIELKEELDALDEFDFDDEFAFDAAKSNLENKIKTAERNAAKAKTESIKKPTVKKETSDKESKPKKVYNNEKLVETIKSKDTSSREKTAAEADLVDSFDTMALNAIKYDTRKGDYDRTEVRDYLRGFFPTILKSYDPSKSKFSTWVYNNIAPKAQQTYEKFKKIAEKSLDAEAGTAGSVKEAVADAPSSREVDTDKVSRKIKPIELVRNPELKSKYKKAIKNIVESGEVSIDKSTFGNLKDLAAEVTAEIFDIPVLKVTDPADNLTYEDVIVEDKNINKIKKYYPEAKVGMVIKSEASKIQDIVKSMGTDLFKLLPPENVAPEIATVDAQAYRPVKGTGLKIPSSLMKVFYEATGKRSKGVTSQTAIKRLKPGLTYEQFLKDLGIVKGQPNTYDRAIGQRLKAITTLFGKLATNAEVRQLEGVTDIQKQNIKAGKSDIMFSKKSKDLLNKFGLNYTEIRSKNDVDIYIEKMVKPLINVFNSEDYKLLNRTVLQFRSKAVGGDKNIADYLRSELKKLNLPKRVSVGRTKPSAAIGNTIEKFEKSRKSGKIDKYNKRNSEVFDKMWNDINDIVSKDPNMAVPIMYFLENSINEATNPHRMGAPIIGYEINAGKLYYEHAVQSQLSYLNLMESILDPNKDFSSEFIKIKENYKVIAISRASNNKLNQAGYALTMPKNWKNWYDRYFNKKVAAIEGGIDPSKLINLNGITFSNEFNIDNKGSKEDGTRLSKVIKEQEIKNNLGLQTGSNHDLLLEVAFSKKKRAEYENVLRKNRPDIKDVPKQVENLFEWADNLNVPENKKPKYKKLALYYTSNGYTIFPEDGYKIEEVIRLSDKNKIDPYAYKNPDELINKFTEEVKTKKINPDNVKQFSNKQEFENGVVVYDVQDSRRGQRAVRDVVDSYWGKDSNPWCLVARKNKRQRVIEDFNQFNTEEEAFKYGDKIKSNGLQVEYELLPDGEGVGVYTFKEAIDEKADLDEAWKMWKEYNQDGLGEGYKIAFQNGKLISFRDGGSQQNFDTLGYSEVEWWDRFDKPTENLAVSLGVDKDTGYKIIGSMDAEGDFDIDGYGEGDFMSQKNNYTLYDADKNLTRKEVYKDGKISLTIENERSKMKDGGQAIARIDTKYIDGVFKSSRYVLEDLNTGDIVNELTRKQTTLDIDSYIQEEVITRKNGKSPKVSKVTFKTTKLIDSSVKDSMNIVTYYDETITDGVSVISTDRMAELEEIKKSYVSFSKSVNQAAKANNNMLPESQRIKGDFINQDVLNKMIDLDDKQREAQISFSKKFNLDKDFNDIIENKTGIAAEKTYGKVKAEVVGASKGKFDFFISPTAEDFVGLLYKTLGKGSKGDAQMAWYKKHLLDPFARAMNNVSRDRASMGRDFKALKKELNIIPKNLKKRLPGEYFTREQAVRVYIWEQVGADVPGLSEADKKTLVDIVKDDPNLQLFATELMKVNKGIAYIKPSENWVSGTITTDLTEGLNSVKRKQYLELWQQNVDEIFSEKNLNKLEAAYGKSYRYALEGTLKRMKTGRNRTFGTDSLTGRFLDWINGTTGAIMFFNNRSAVLQTISMANFINFEDNNVFAAAKAFANQKQYWSDFKMLFNSDFLVERRDGLKLNVQESDIADIAKERGARGVINRILKLGFTPTQLADSFAIASGGSTFYRNRLNKLIKEGMDPLAAKKQAMMDFRETAEESQQSSRPDKISQQQAGPLGRTVLAFANTPAQYARIMKKAALDIKNGRGDFKTNVSKIMYYGFLQNLIFNTLTNALFAIEFGEDEEEENKKYVSVANGMADSILRGIGVSGVIVSVLKNAALTFVREDKKKNPNYEKVVDDLLRISPPIASKVSKIKSASRSYKWDKKEMREKGFSLDNPAYLAGANVISAGSNLPLDRVIKKMDHIRAASNSELETYKRIFLLGGWSEWDLGIKKPKKQKDKEKKKQTKSKSKTYKRKTYKTKIYK